jgi:Fe-S oxidoreductase
MMVRRELPELVAEPDRARAKALAEAVVDPGELLWSRRSDPGLDTAFASSPDGKIAYHAPCHLRAQAIGFRGRDLLRKLPGVTGVASVLECCGHDGTYAMKVEGFDASKKVGKRSFDELDAAEAALWVTDCPLAALQFAQHAGRKALHPMTVLARAYRGDSFADGKENKR